MSNLKNYLNIEDLRVGARKRLPKGLFVYMDSGCEDQVALNNNRAAFERHRLRVRVMNDVSRMNLGAELFGKPVSLPLAVAPTAISGMCWHEGEVALARGAAAKGVPYILSTNSITSLEKVAKSTDGRIWFQLYTWRDREMTYQLVKRAKDAGYEALVVSADSGRGSVRESAKRYGFSVPYRASIRSLIDIGLHPRWLTQVMLRYLVTSGMPRNENFPEEYRRKITEDPTARGVLKADTLVWDDIDRLRERWSGPLLVKGIMHPDDARMALQHGADGVIVSNHGGRSMDCAAAPIDVLPEVVDAVGDRMTVIMDSGVRRGGDIVKALVCGAKAVLVGRAPLYGVSVAGQEGVERALSLLSTEMEKTMALLGATSVAALNRDMIFSK